MGHKWCWYTCTNTNHVSVHYLQLKCFANARITITLEHSSLSDTHSNNTNRTFWPKSLHQLHVKLRKNAILVTFHLQLSVMDLHAHACNHLHNIVMCKSQNVKSTFNPIVFAQFVSCLSWTRSSVFTVVADQTTKLMVPNTTTFSAYICYNLEITYLSYP